MDEKIKYNIKYSDTLWLRIAKFYTFFSYSEKFHNNLVKKFITKFNPYNKTLIDIGFGSGQLIYQLHIKYNMKVIGTDISEKTVTQFNKKIRKKKLQNIIAIKLNPYQETLPFKTNSTDFITCNHVLEHVKNDLKLLQELKRVLKKDGIGIIMIPINEENLEVPTHLRKYNTKNFINLLKKLFNIYYYEENDVITNFIRILGVKNKIWSNTLKRIVIFIFSFIPFPFLYKIDKLLKKFLTPSQLMIIIGLK